MKKIWIALLVVATFGSIYPFDFQASRLDPMTLTLFLQSCCVSSHPGDILGNIILFAPIGFTGMLALAPEGSRRRGFLLVCLISTALAFALQVVQIFLPSRDESLQDVFWNMIGTLGGAALASVVGSLSLQSGRSRVDAALVPFTLIGTWLVYRLIPFVPSLDFQLIKDSLKPALDFQMVPVDTLHDITAWVVVAYLLRHARNGIRLDTHLPVVMVAVFCLEVVIVDNAISTSNLLGAMLAVVLWWGVLIHIPWQEYAIVALLLVSLTVSGLAPFHLGFGSISFNWFPFHGFLGGSMYLNAVAAVEKVFFYGGLVYVLRQTNMKAFPSFFIGFSFVAAVEIAQTRFVGHTPEITDPLLVALAALAILTLERQEEKIALAGQSVEETSTDRPGQTRQTIAEPKRSNGEWVSFSVNLRKDQHDFLSRLSEEMGVSISRVTRRIVGSFIEESRRTDRIVPMSAMVIGMPVDRTGQWVRQTVNLRGSQFDIIDRLSREADHSVSSVLRHIVVRFIDALEDADEANA